MKEKIRKIKENIQLWHILAFCVLTLLLILIFTNKTNNKTNYSPEEQRIRQAAFAGTWYPGTEQALSKEIEGFMSNVEILNMEERINAIIVPHAGYRFSGQTAATAYRQLKDIYDTVILIGPSHQVAFSGAGLPNATHFSTPLGIIKISEKAEQLLKEKHFSSRAEAHDKEHCLEIQLPFLQKTLTNFEIIPILIGSYTDKTALKEIASVLEKYTDDKTLIIISTDFTHYGVNYGYLPFVEDIPQNLQKLDEAAIEKIMDIAPEGFFDYCSKTEITICGKYPIAILLYMLEDKAITIRPDILFYDTSGKITGDYTNSVSYATIVFSSNETDSREELSKHEQEILLKFARSTLENYLKNGKKPDINSDIGRLGITPALKEVRGCFTTLNLNSNLRGCIGHILPQEELYRCVMDNSISAALHDTRFKPVKYDELEDIEIEISVLTVPKRLDFSSGEDLKNKLRPLVDGVVLKKGFYQSTYLPQVWEQLPEKEEFLSNLCAKAGMSPDCWRDTSTEVYTYQAFVFNE